jgi:hypothetical protein
VELEAQPTSAAWAAIDAVIEREDPLCRGVVLLGLDAAANELRRSFALAAGCPRVKGFAVGRTIFGDAARDWLAGRIDDEGAIAAMAARFADFVAAWDSAATRPVPNPSLARCIAFPRRTPDHAHPHRSQPHRLVQRRSAGMIGERHRWRPASRRPGRLVLRAWSLATSFRGRPTL